MINPIEPIVGDMPRLLVAFNDTGAGSFQHLCRRTLQRQRNDREVVMQTVKRHDSVSGQRTAQAGYIERYVVRQLKHLARFKHAQPVIDVTLGVHDGCDVRRVTECGVASAPRTCRCGRRVTHFAGFADSPHSAPTLGMLLRNPARIADQPIRSFHGLPSTSTR